MTSLAVPYPDFGGGRWGGGHRCRSVVVAEDQQHIARLIQVNLERQGIIVAAAASAVAAKSLIDSQKPDLVFVSVGMPQGADLISAIKSSSGTADIRVIALTNLPTDAETFQLWQRGADAIVQKPFNPIDILRLAGL